MATIKVNVREFSNLILHMLLDKLLNPEEIMTGNEDFEEFVEFLEEHRARIMLIKIYRDLDSELRREYKRLRKTLEIDGDQKMFLFVDPTEDEEEKNEEVRYNLTKEDIENIVFKSVQAATKKENPKLDKVKNLSENIIEDLQLKEDM